MVRHWSQTAHCIDAGADDAPMVHPKLATVAGNGSAVAGSEGCDG